MPQFPAEFEQALRVVLPKLAEAGWIEVGGIHGEAYGFRWTPKGRKRAREIKQIDDELQLGPRLLAVVMVLAQLHPPMPEAD